MVTSSASPPRSPARSARLPARRRTTLGLILAGLALAPSPGRAVGAERAKPPAAATAAAVAATTATAAAEPAGDHHGADLGLGRRTTAVSAGRAAGEPAEPVLTDWAPISVIGGPGTFGSLVADRSHGVDLVGVDGWRFLPGQAAYFAAVDGAGRVIIANEPQTDVQPRPTGDAMVFSTFDPATRSFANHPVPTSRGALTTVATVPGGVGGADIADVQIIKGLGGDRLAFTSMAPYNGWDASTRGVYPSLTILDETAAGWTPEAGRRYTAAELETAGGAGETVCGRRVPTFGDLIADCGGIAEIDNLPSSGYLAATQYFGHPETGQTNGMIVVLDPAGRVAAALPYPRTVDVDGQEITVRPREVDADPTSVRDDERFLVIFDVDPDTARGVQPAFAAQEFRYVASRAVIEAISKPFTTGGTVHGRRAGTETALYDSRGNLWLVDSAPGSLSGGRTSVYRPGAGRQRLQVGACAADVDSVSRGWGSACAPDATTDATLDAGGPVRSLSDDAARGRVIAVTMGGAVVSITDDLRTTTLVLPLNAIGDRSVLSIGPRKGAVDVARDALWIPIQQLQTARTCAAWPCSPERLDQWLVRIDLSEL